MAYRRTGVGMAFIRSFRFTPAEADAFTKLRTIHRPRLRLAAIAHRSRRAWCMADWSTGGGMTLIGLFRFAPAKVHAAPELATIDGFRLTTVADGDRCSSHMTDGEARVFMAFVRSFRFTPCEVHALSQGRTINGLGFTAVHDSDGRTGFVTDGRIAMPTRRLILWFTPSTVVSTFTQHLTVWPRIILAIANGVRVFGRIADRFSRCRVTGLWSHRFAPRTGVGTETQHTAFCGRRLWRNRRVCSGVPRFSACPHFKLTSDAAFTGRPTFSAEIKAWRDSSILARGGQSAATASIHDVLIVGRCARIGLICEATPHQEAECRQW